MLYVNNTKDIGIGVMDMKPARKKPCLVVKTGNAVTKVASFNNEETANWFMVVLGEFLGVSYDVREEANADRTD